MVDLCTKPVTVVAQLVLKLLAFEFALFHNCFLYLKQNFKILSNSSKVHMLS